MRNKWVFGLALVFGLLAAFLTYFYLHSVTTEAQNRVYTQVVTATQDIPVNTTLTKDMVELKPFPTDLRNNKELVDVTEAVGKINVVSISKGEILLQNRIVKPGESTDRLAYTIPQGLRAMSVPVDEVSGVANMVKKGDRVDIITAVSLTNSGDRSVVVLQNVLVLAVGTSINQSGVPAAEANASPKTVTVAVDLQSSLRLKMALTKGETSLVLRSPSDKDSVTTVPVGADQF